jgi:uncharacterized protein YjbI with pentapeptide repeats
MLMREGEPMADVQTPVDEVQGAAKPAADGATAAAPAAEMPPTAAAFAGKAKDLGALRDAVVDAANVGAGLWFSYLFVLLYLVVAVGSVTHRNLLFESPVKLPFLGVDLPLVGFFVLGPALFLIVHAYVLLHFAMLADKVGVFHAELQAQIADDNTRARLRRQLPSNIFVQFLAGPIEVRSGLIGTMLRLIAQISLVAGPLALLVFFQLQFLPYHAERTSWCQRIAVVADLALLWSLWPSVARGERSAIGWRDLRRPHVAGAAVASLVPLLLVFTIATFPGEWLDKNSLSAPIFPQFETKSLSGSVRLSIRWRTPHQVLVAGNVDLVARKTTSLWSNRLVLPNFEVKSEDNVSLRGRRLEGAVLLGAKLPKMDFTAARLEGAVLDDADLGEAKFPCAKQLKGGDESASSAIAEEAGERCTDLQGASLVGARLQGADFSGAQMQETKLGEADLQKATLDKAHMQGARLDNANLQGASLKETQMWGASLRKARLQGASLEGAELDGAFLDGAQVQNANLAGASLRGASITAAQLQGAVLDAAQLQGATLAGSKMYGATLSYAGLQGASFNRTVLQGAVLDYARLHGTRLETADLKNASLQRVIAWRARISPIQRGPLIVEPETVLKREEGPRRHGAEPDCLWKHDCEWNAETFAVLKQKIMDSVPEGDARMRLLERLVVLDPGTPLDGEEAMAGAWIKLAQSPPSPDEFDKGLAESLLPAGCDEKEGTSHAIRGVLKIFGYRFENADPPWRKLAAAFLDEAHCPGARGLSNDDKATLKAARDGAPR